jgi:plasmid maintenance system antidote protein VapI
LGHTWSRSRSRDWIIDAAETLNDLRVPSDRFWMNLQSRNDLDVQLETHREELDKIGPLVA